MGHSDSIARCHVGDCMLSTRNFQRAARLSRVDEFAGKRKMEELVCAGGHTNHVLLDYQAHYRGYASSGRANPVSSRLGNSFLLSPPLAYL